MPVGLKFSLSLEDSQFLRSLKRTNKGIEDTARNIALLRNLVVIDLAIDAFMRLADAATLVAEKGAELIQFRLTVERMLGSTEKAEDFLRALNSAAGEFGIDPTALQQGGKQLLAFGFGADEARESLLQLSAVSVTTGSRVDELIDAFGKARTSGVQMEDINKFTERGVDLFSDLAVVLNTDQQNIRKLVSQGKVGFKDLAAAIKLATDEGGKFAGALEDIADTNLGKFNRVKAQITAGIAELGAGLIEGVNLESIAQDLGLGGILSSDLGETAEQFQAVGLAVGEFASEFIRWNTELIDFLNTINPAIIGIEAVKAVVGELREGEQVTSDLILATTQYGKVTQQNIEDAAEELGISKERLEVIQEINRVSKEAADGLASIQNDIAASVQKLSASVESMRKKVKGLAGSQTALELIGTEGPERLNILGRQLRELVAESGRLAGSLKIDEDNLLDPEALQRVRDQVRLLGSDIAEEFSPIVDPARLDELKELFSVLESAAKVEFSGQVLGPASLAELEAAAKKIESLDLSLFPEETQEKIRPILELFNEAGDIVFDAGEVRDRLTAAFEAAKDLKQETQATAGQFESEQKEIKKALELLDQMESTQESIERGVERTNKARERESKKIADANRQAQTQVDLAAARLQGAEAVAQVEERIKRAALQEKGVDDDRIDILLEKERALREAEKGKEQEREDAALRDLAAELDIAEAIAVGNSELATQLELERERLRLKEEFKNLNEEEVDALAKRKFLLENLPQQFPDLDLGRIIQEAPDAALEFGNRVLESAADIKDLIADLNEAASASPERAEAIGSATAQLKEQLAAQRKLEAEQRKNDRGRRNERTRTFNQEESAARARERRSSASIRRELERERFFAGEDPTADEIERLRELEADLEQARARGDENRGRAQRQRDAERENFLDEAAAQRGDRDAVARQKAAEKEAKVAADAKKKLDREAAARKKAEDDVGVNIAKLTELVPLAKTRNNLLVSIDETLDERLPDKAL
jgi:tape measure domain-containing protein